MTLRFHMLLLLAASAVAPALADGTHAFLWAEAQTHMSRARTTEEFSDAADIYQRLVDDGVRNGTVWYDLGTARLLADDPSGARSALLRAERFLGTTPEIKRNLDRAGLTLEGRQDKSLPWHRVPLFWHYALPCPVRTVVLAAAFSGLWLALSLRLMGARRFSRSLGSVSLAVLVIFASSVAATLHAEAQADRQEALREIYPAVMEHDRADRGRRTAGEEE